jgi:hypothetical protein
MPSLLAHQNKTADKPSAPLGGRRLLLHSPGLLQAHPCGQGIKFQPCFGNKTPSFFTAVTFFNAYDCRLNNASALNQPQYDCNNGNDKENVYDVSDTVADKSDYPANDQNDRDDIK